jgi:hypothetical protein
LYRPTAILEETVPKTGGDAVTKQLLVISADELAKRKYWVGEIRKLSGIFQDDFARLQAELANEAEKTNFISLLGHLRLCGAIPETYAHDSTEEKLYSKYTDAILSNTFTAMGIVSLVLEERADCADVECVTDKFSFVADAKAFRLSRTAKNQKDFKVDAMHGWKRGKEFAIVVCPSYQLPNRASQIYAQAVARNVCLLTYSHLALLLQIAFRNGRATAIEGLHAILKTIVTLNPTKDAVTYWRAINTAILSVDESIQGFWQTEKAASLDAISIAKEEALTALAVERERIMKLSRTEAIKELVSKAKLDNRAAKIHAVADNGILDLT